MIIGIIGTNGSGKDTIAEFIRQKGFEYFSCSDIIREECKKKGLETNRDNLIVMGNKLRTQFGPEILAKRIIEKIKKKKVKNAIIVSVRNPSEIKEIKKQNGIMIAVDAPIDIRYKRILNRKREEDFVSFEKFKEQEKKEMESNDINSQQLKKCIDLADYNITNNSSLNDLYKQIDKILKENGI